jgi:hypothetical protein
MSLITRIALSGSLMVSVAGLSLLAGCGPATALTDSSGGNSSSLNFSSPYAEITLSTPSELTSPDPGDGADGITTGDNFASGCGENVVAGALQGRFSPDWSPETSVSTARLAWATYWLDMTDLDQAASLLLTWSTQPDAENVWVGFADWNTDKWVWHQLSAVATVTPPNSFARFKRASDQMLAITILVLGSQPALLDEIKTDQEPTPPPVQGLLNENAHLGINLGAIVDWAPAVTFTDVFKTARAWIPQDVAPGGPWDNGHAINVDSDGWVTSLDPGQAVVTMLMVNVAGVYPSGQYICLYDGEGTIEFAGDASIASSTPGRIVVDIASTGGSTRLRIVATNPLDYIRNIRLILPGFEETYVDEPFHPDFLATLSNFKVLRFMDWGATNYSEVSTWQDRTTPTRFTQATQSGTKAGVSLEYMVDLCNETLCDAWICIPYLATDDYIRNAATLVRDRLDPRLRVYFEYSNEVWNSIFPSAGYARAQGLALGLSTNEFTAQLRFYAQRSQEAMAICSTVFEQQPDRLLRVAAGQSTNSWVGTTILDWDSTQGAVDSTNVTERFDHYAVAPYFGGYLGVLPQATTTATMTLPELIQACDDHSLSNNGPGGATSSNASNAVDRGITLISYEGGQHLVGVGAAKNDNTLTDLFLLANRDMSMRTVYADDLRRWDSSGGGLFMAFAHISTYSKHGSWGILESQYQDTNTAPKWLGLMDWLAEVSQTQ